MQTIDVLAALLSALLHAGWNAAVKASPRPTEAMASQMYFSALIMLACLLFTGLPARESWPWIAGSMVMNTITVAALLRSYELAGFGIAYTFARAISVVLIVPLAATIAGDTMRPWAFGGIVLIFTSLAILTVGSKTDKPIGRQALMWIAISGVSAAAYLICDAQGVRQSGSALAYGCTVSIANALAMAWRIRKVKSPLLVLREDWRIGIPTAVAAVISYILILWVWTHAPIAPSAALRDTSSVFAIIIATLFLREPMTRTRLVAVLLAIMAVPLLRLA